MISDPRPAREQLLELLQQHRKEHPGVPVSFTQLADALGLSRERVRQLYRQLARQYVLPAVQKPGAGGVGQRTQHKQRILRTVALARQVKPLRDRGMQQDEIARTLGTSPYSVREAVEYLKLTGETVAKVASRQTRELETTVRAYRAKGMSLPDIAAATGKSWSGIEHVVKRLAARGEDITLPSRQDGRWGPYLRQRQALDAQVKALRQEGKHWTEIAQRFGLSRNQVTASITRLIKAGEVPQVRLGVSKGHATQTRRPPSAARRGRPPRLKRRSRATSEALDGQGDGQGDGERDEGSR